MPNEKIENQLNLALDATQEEREKSLDLDVGYAPEEKTWEVIVKFSGATAELEALLKARFPREYPGIRLTDLSNEYAILTLPEGLVQQVAELTEIEYMEKPKRLFFTVNNGKRASCISPLQTGGEEESDGRNRLSGRGVLVAVIDSGIDYSHPDFRNPNGSTRILALWDQTVPSGSVADPRSMAGEASEGEASEEGEVKQQFLQAPEGFYLGTEFPEEVINLALDQPSEQLRYRICPSRDNSGHGTHVAGIAAGNGRASAGRYRGVAYESDLLVVKLGVQREDGFPRTSELMQAVDYCIRKAESYGRPVALNLSFGNNYGSHSGTSLIETFLDDMADRYRNSIVVGSGNEGAAAVHTSGRVREGSGEVVQFAVSPYESGLNLQIWKSYADEMAISIVHPNGTVIGPIQEIQELQRFTIRNTQILLYYGQPSPYSRYQEIYFDFIPEGQFIDSGVWEIRLFPQRIVTGEYDMWLPSGGVLNEGTAFLKPTEETTLTLPSTASKVITVGAYDALYNQLASFSGRGYTRETNQVKPDLAAPGVEITSCAPGGGYVSRSGTSMATPFVTGSAALLMQWGIVFGNDPYLYGEKLKAYLIRGARHLPILNTYPNPELGWGVLCAADSLPG